MGTDRDSGRIYDRQSEAQSRWFSETVIEDIRADPRAGVADGWNWNVAAWKRLWLQTCQHDRYWVTCHHCYVPIRCENCRHWTALKHAGEGVITRIEYGSAGYTKLIFMGTCAHDTTVFSESRSSHSSCPNFETSNAVTCP